MLCHLLECSTVSDDGICPAVRLFGAGSVSRIFSWDFDGLRGWLSTCAWCTYVNVEGMHRSKGEQLGGDEKQAEYMIATTRRRDQDDYHDRQVPVPKIKFSLTHVAKFEVWMGDARRTFALWVAFLSALERCARGRGICECVWDSKREGASGVGIMAAIEDVNQR